MVGESLRAAGLTKRRDDVEDVFTAENSTQSLRRPRTSDELAPRPPLASAQRPESRALIRIDRPFTTSLTPRTPANVNQGSQRGAQLSLSSRPSTSMAAFRRDEPLTAPPILRTQRSAYDRQTNTVPEVVPRPPSQARNSYPATERLSSSPSGYARRPLATPSNPQPGSASTPEHIRVMLDSLNMFESHLARLPSMGSTTTVTIPDLFRSAQNIVHSSNALNNLLRDGTSHALEQQIDAEVADSDVPVDPIEIWRSVGSEYRESLRVSDELIRTMTTFLLGVGKLLRESTAERTHNRTSSLDETSVRRLTPDIVIGPARSSNSGGARSSDGLNSLDMKRRWDSSSGDLVGGSTTSFPSASSSSQPSSASRTTSNLKARFDPDPVVQEVDDSMEAGRLARVPSTTRRLSALQDTRETQNASPAVRTPAPVDRFQRSTDSPSAAAPTNGTLGRTQGSQLRRSTTISVPPPLPSLPSESLLERSSSTSKSLSRRAKMSTMSNATVRANSIIPSLSTTNPTTAVTATAVSASPETTVAPGRSTATLSRRTGAAIAGLQEQMQRDGRQRTISDEAPATTAAARKLQSGSETERDWRTMGRPRASLDSNTPLSTSRALVPRSAVNSALVRRDRRGTVAGLFSRN